MPVSWPATGTPVPRISEPIARNNTIAATLISANQNSISANHFTPIRFIVATMQSATSAKIHCGTPANGAQ